MGAFVDVNQRVDNEIMLQEAVESEFKKQTAEFNDVHALLKREIFHRKKIEQELLLIKRDQRMIMDSVETMIWFKDRDNRIIRANRLAAQTLGLTVEEIEGKSTEELCPDEAAKYHMDDLEVIRTGKPKLGIIELCQTAHGEKIWVKTDKIPYYDEAGNVSGVIILAQDISEKKRAENKLQENAELYRRVLAAANDGIWDWNLEANEIFWNDRLYQIIGQSRSTFNLTNEAHWDLIHPDDRHYVIQQIKQHLENPGSTYSVEYRMLHKSGDYRYCLSLGMAIRDGAGHPIRMAGTTKDITERKLEEKRRQKSLEREQLVRRVIELVGQSFDIDFILKATAHEVGLFFEADRCIVSRYEGDGEDFNVCIDSQYCSTMDIIPVLAKDIPLRSMGLLREHTQNTQMPLLINTSGVSTFPRHLNRYMQKYEIKSVLGLEIFYRGKPCGLITLHQCHYDRVWQQEEIELLQTLVAPLGVALYQAELFQENIKARETAETSNRRKDQFLANVSHEFRTPLNAIIGFSEMLEKGIAGNVTPKQYQYAHNISLSGRHLLAMVDDLLDISKIEAGHIRMYTQWVELGSFLQQIEEIFVDLAASLKVQLKFHLQPDLQGLHTDPARLRQILYNLISNAIKFSHENSEVWVRMHLSDDQQWVVCAVSDTGIGIPQEDLPKLFSKYFQVDTQLNRLQAGTGLGLALTKKLVTLLKGTIAVDSCEGKGSTFTFTLPAVERASP